MNDPSWINESPLGTTLRVQEAFHGEVLEFFIRKTEHGWETAGKVLTSGYPWSPHALTRLEVIGEETP